MPHKDPQRRREYKAEQRRRYRAQRTPSYEAHEARRFAKLRAAILAEKLRRGKCSAPDCPLGGLAVTPDNAVAFDFDHRDRFEKRTLIGRMRGQISVVEEMAKCDLLCAFCHRLKTQAGGDYRPLSVADLVTEVPRPTLFD